MVRRACRYLIREGPVTAQDRWEESSGYSPSTLAAHIAGLICAAEFLADRGEHSTAEFVRDYADFLEWHIERWTVTTRGTLVPGISRHYIRINPGDINHCADEDPNCGTVVLANRPPGTRYQFPANDIVDAGFLELVRYGVRSADDSTVQDSIRVVDAVLKVETPYGPSWRRYNHDGYGQRDDGTSYSDWGAGRPWPLLTANVAIMKSLPATILPRTCGHSRTSHKVLVLYRSKFGTRRTCPRIFFISVDQRMLRCRWSELILNT